MGFTTGFLGGLTTTYTLLYLSLHLHRTNRQHQSLLLTQQRTLLTSLTDPQPITYESPAYEIRKAGIAEEIKDRWNREVSNVVRNVQETDWTEVREKVERGWGVVWGKMRSSEVGERVEEVVKERLEVREELDLKEAGERVKGSVRDSVGRVKDSVDRAKDSMGKVKGEAEQAIHGRRLLELK